VRDVFTGQALSGARGALTVEQPAHSVRTFKLLDSATPLPHLTVSAKPLQEGHTGDELVFSAIPSNAEYPVLTYEWSFGDGVATVAPTPTHTYTAAGIYVVNVKTTFLGGNTAEDHFKVSIKGVMNTQFDPTQKRRLTTPE
jgi:hypothetical protein